MKWTKQIKRMIIVILVCLILACVFVVYLELIHKQSSVERFEQASPQSNRAQTDAITPPSTESESADSPPALSEPYQSPVDFQLLQESNPEIYAWCYSANYSL